MSKPIPAVYEQGVFRPLDPIEFPEGQSVVLSVEPLAMTLAQAEAQLGQWRQVYDGLNGEDVAQIEQLALDRSRFARDLPEET